MFGCDWYDIEQNAPTETVMSDCDREWQEFNESQQIPLWSMPILWTGSIVVAFVLNRLVEEPMRKCLRPEER